MTDIVKRNSIAQWAFDTRPVLSRFHLWLDDVTVERESGQDKPISELSFMPRGIARCLAMTSAVTALGTQLYGEFGEGAGADLVTINQVKKAADAISAYVMSEGLWHLTRTLPENHAIMVSLGEGLMPKAGETPEMGANPLLGFGRVYARPEVAKYIDRQVHRLLNDPERTWDDFYGAIKNRGLTIWGAAIDTLENTSRFALGKTTGPMSIFHLFDQPLTMSRPYESYMGSLTVPRKVVDAAEKNSVLLDFLTPRAQVVDAIKLAYPGIAPAHIHVWTLRGKSRAARLAGLWKSWTDLGVHLVTDDWKAPTGIEVFTDSGTYAPTYMVGDWQDDDGATHAFLCDGYAATAEAMQAASLSEVLDVSVSMAPYSPKFELHTEQEAELMKLDPHSDDFAADLAAIFGGAIGEDRVDYYREVILDAYTSNMPMGKRVIQADDFFPEKRWRVLACAGYMLPDPYTGTPGVEKLSDDTYRVTTRLATHRASSKITFIFRLMESVDESRLVFSPLLTRFLSGMDYRKRAVKVSDSGRIRNELQTMMVQALEYDGDTIRVHFDRVDDRVMPADKQAAIIDVLAWYKANHPAWFQWLEVVA